MKKTIVSTNWLNKVIAAMMMIAITTAMPAMAGNKKHNNHDKNTTVVVVTNDKKASHFDKVDKRTFHFDAHKKHAYRPDMKSYTFKVSRHDEHKTKVSTIRQVVAKVENMKGVKEAKWNPRTREVTVIYDANVTSARNIKHFVA